MLSKKDLIIINKRFSNGIVVNKSSLEYLVDYSGKSKNWIKTLAHLIRAILLDHIFEDGNKRTAAVVIAYFLDAKGYSYNIDYINIIILRIIKKNITSIEEIERLIENVIKSGIEENR